MIIKRLNSTLFFSFFAVALLFVSCDDKQVFDQYQTTGGAWNVSDVKKFTFEQQDSLTPFNLFVNVRDNSDYPYNNLFLIIKMSDPSGRAVVDTLEYQMAHPDGTLLGNGFSDVKESQLFYREMFVFSKPGTYTFEIEQAAREQGEVKGDSLLKGISEIGFRVEKIN